MRPFVRSTMPLHPPAGHLAARSARGTVIDHGVVPHTTDQIEQYQGERMFRAAARHSRIVRFLRYAIPSGIATIASVVVFAAFLNPFRLITRFPIALGKISLSGTKIIMDLPRVSGFTTDLRPYTMTAYSAMQDITKPDILEMTQIDALLELKDGQHVTIKSINGTYDTKREILKLQDHIVLNTTAGHEGHLSEATVNVTTGTVISESPVEMKFPIDGLLTANRMKVERNGDLIVFYGGVEMTINPDQVRSAPQNVSSPSPPVQTSIQHTADQPPLRAP
jgi:lipopolysaccharide export system protein LptC